jgi:acetylornithine/succinyldiaminopimelate/putrescine aminotransferase
VRGQGLMLGIELTALRPLIDVRPKPACCSA